MAHWKEVLTHISPDAEARMAELRGRLYSQLGGIGPTKIITFRGYGTPERLYVRGLVIEEKVYLAGEKNDRVWADLLDFYTYAHSEPVPFACLVARFQGEERTINADAAGYFKVQFEPKRPLVDQRLWHPVEFHLIDPIPDAQSRYPIKAVGEVLVPAKTARYGVISNTDKAVLPGDPSELLHMARNAFMRTPHNRLAFPGEAALQRAFYNGISGAEMNPLFYLSSGPGSLYSLLVQYINLQSMPNGPVLFTAKDKFSRLREMLSLFPDLPFILFGNSDQDDPVIYTKLAEEYPGRILAIYLRYTHMHPWKPETPEALARRALKAGSLLVLAHDALAIASHAVERGFLPASVLPAVFEDMQKDASPQSPVEALLSEPADPRQRVVKFSRQGVKKASSERRLPPIEEEVNTSSAELKKKNK